MIESRSGYWWTDHDEGKKVPGTLSWAGDHWQLDIVGMLPSHAQWTDGLSVVPELTIFGVCLGEKFTLRGCHLQRSKGLHTTQDNDQPSGIDDQNYQEWLAWSMLSGGNCPDETLYKSAYFSLTGLAAWWPAHKLEAIKSIDDLLSEGAEPIEVVIDDEMTIEIHIGVGERHGVRKFVVEKSVNFFVKNSKGFTLDELMQDVVLPLKTLLGIVTQREVKYFDMSLQPSERSEIEELRNIDTHSVKVDPGVVADDDNHMRSYLAFTPDNVDLQSLIKNWIKLSPSTLVPRSVAEAQDNGGSLQIQVVEAVNAAETLHRALHEERREFPFADKVSAALSNCEGLNRKDRDKVKSAVKLSEVSLKVRLVELANAVGEDFCLWFFDGKLDEWADVASVVRNALSHGYPTRHNVEQDIGVLIGVYKCTIAVIRLRLLVESGIPKDYSLVERLTKDREYLALVRQSVANWEELVGKIRPQN